MTAEPTAHALRQERDRFLGFAFAGADSLVELDGAGIVRYALGATQAVFGERSEDLLGRLFVDLVAGEQRASADAVLVAIVRGERAPLLRVRFAGSGPTGPVVELAGHRIPDLGNRTFLQIRLANGDPVGEAPAQARDDDGFEAYGSDVLRAAEEAAAKGRTTELTLVRLPGLATLQGRLDREKWDALRERIGSTLQGAAVGAGLARQVGDESYSIVHDAEAEVDTVIADAFRLADAASPPGTLLAPQTAHVTLDPAGTTSAQAVRAVAFALRRFEDLPDSSIGRTTLSEACRTMVVDTIGRIAAFRRVVAAGDFDLAVQPIVDLKTRATHHYEVLCRFRGELAGSPHRTITFAEEVGAVSDFDLSVLRRSLELILTSKKAGRDVSLAINVSVHSLETPSFVAALEASLRHHEAIRPNVIFEVTETGRIKDLDGVAATITAIRAAGSRIFLDDFGAGSAAFQYLRALPVDGVKIDGLYVREALTSPRSGTFLRAMVYLCRELGVEVIGEMIENEETALFLADCGVQLGQGFLFGRPTVPRLSGGRMWLADPTPQSTTT